MSRSSNPPKLERKTAVPLDYEITEVHVDTTNDNSNYHVGTTNDKSNYSSVDREYPEFEDDAVESNRQPSSKPPVEGGKAKRSKSKSKSKKKKSKSPAKKSKGKKK